jgi:threonine/homoserine/homoserine lactone efflux protein
MTPDMILTLTGLALASTWTPGPNNAMVASSGATFGVRATVPHALGVAIGFPIMIFLVAIGLGEMFRQSALLREALRLFGILALIWVSWRIATAAAPGSGTRSSRPFTFLQAVGFQWINPKAWVMAIGITALYATDQNPVLNAVAIALVFMASGMTSAFGWTYFGASLQRWLKSSRHLRLFNLTMAGLILTSIGVVAFAELG